MSSLRPTSAALTRGAGSTDPRLRRRGQGSVRRSTGLDCTPRRGCFTRDRLRHRLRRVIEPLDERSARRRRVERSPLERRDSQPDAEVPRHLRLLLERLVVRDVRPRPRRDRLDDALNEAAGRPRPIASPSRSPVLRCAPSRTSRKCSTPSKSSESFTTVTAISSLRPRAPVRRSSRRSTTAARGATGAATLLFVAHRKEILEQALRTYREVLTDANFGELYVGGSVRSAGSTSLPVSSR